MTSTISCFKHILNTKQDFWVIH